MNDNKQQNDNKRYINMKHAHMGSIWDNLKSVAFDTAHNIHVHAYRGFSLYTIIDYLLRLESSWIANLAM